jgi:hypothetical protein
LLPAAILLLHHVTAVAEMMYLPSCSQTVIIFLALLFHLSGIMSQYNEKYIFNLFFSSLHFNWMQPSSGEIY